MKKSGNKYIQRYREDFEYRTVVNTLCSSAGSLIFGTYNLVLALLATSYYGAVWWGAFCAYYYALAAVRIALLISHKVGVMRAENATMSAGRDAANYLGCGAALVALTLTLSGVIVLTVTKGMYRSYIGHLIFGVAFYTFWKISMAIYNIVKAKKVSLTVQAYRSVNIADALVSIVSLQAAMLAAFSTAEDGFSIYTFNAVTGGVVGACILAFASFMIIRGARILAAKRLSGDSDETR